MNKKIFFVIVFLFFICICNSCFAITDIPKSLVVPTSNDLSIYFNSVVDYDSTFISNDYDTFLVFDCSTENSNTLGIFAFHDYCDVTFTSNGAYFQYNQDVSDIPTNQRPVIFYEFSDYNQLTYLNLSMQFGSSNVSGDEIIFYITGATFTSLQNSSFVYSNKDINYSYNGNTFSTTSSNYFTATVTDSNQNVIFEVTDSSSSGGGGDSGGGSSGSSQDYSNVLAHIDSQVTATNSIVDSIDTTTFIIQGQINDISATADSIDNSVSDIKDYLIGYNNDISNTIVSTSETTQNMIQSQTQQQQSNFNTITNTTSYNTSDVVIDTSFNTITDVNGVDSFIVRIYNIIYGFFNDLDTSLVVNITIPVPFTNESFVLSTSSLQNFYAEHTALSNLITISWYFVFGIYIFRLAYTFWISSVTGEVFRDTEGFTANLDSDNLVKSLFL